MIDMNYSEQEKLKIRASKVLRDSRDTGERLYAGIGIILVYYQRAKKDGLMGESELSFREYASLWLRSCGRIEFRGCNDVYTALVSIYGLKDGFKDGKAFFQFEV